MTLVTPQEGDVICGTPLHVELNVENFTLVEPEVDENGIPIEDPDAAAGSGHIDIMLNGQDAAMIWSESTDISSVEDGAWQLRVELSNADHSPVEPYVGSTVYITVDNSLCL